MKVYKVVVEEFPIKTQEGTLAQVSVEAATHCTSVSMGMMGST